LISNIHRKTALIGVASFIAAASLFGAPGGTPAAQAAGCVKFVGSNWDAPGDDNYMPQLNDEWVKIKNTCSTTQSIGGWKIHDYNKIHTYKFASGTSIAVGARITLRSGTGTNTTSTKYWQRSYGAVWNNTGTERAYLRNSAGTVMSTWVE
jgi:hypothetical protein